MCGTDGRPAPSRASLTPRRFPCIGDNLAITDSAVSRTLLDQPFDVPRHEQHCLVFPLLLTPYCSLGASWWMERRHHPSPMKYALRTTA